MVFFQMAVWKMCTSNREALFSNVSLAYSRKKRLQKNFLKTKKNSLPKHILFINPPLFVCFSVSHGHLNSAHVSSIPGHTDLLQKPRNGGYNVYIVARLRGYKANTILGHEIITNLIVPLRKNYTRFECVLSSSHSVRV